MASKHKVAKKKEREREVAEKLYRRRVAKAKKAKEDQKLDMEAVRTLMKKKPFRKPRNPEEAEAMRLHDEEIHKKIEHNLEILKALEEEYHREQAMRKQVNDQLEAQGHLTPEAKFNAIQEQAKLNYDNNTIN